MREPNVKGADVQARMPETHEMQASEGDRVAAGGGMLFRRPDGVWEGPVRLSHLCVLRSPSPQACCYRQRGQHLLAGQEAREQIAPRTWRRN